MFVNLTIPIYKFKFKKYNEKIYLWDSIRSKYVKYTQEEWVRQNFIMFLVHNMGYIKNLISLEKTFSNNNKLMRYDVLIYKNNVPKLLIECKNPSIDLDNRLIQQITTYNYKLKVPFIIITNGIKFICLKICYHNTASYSFLDQIPLYSEL
ncbi:MAG: type I restriction enzyme HsdR N-terminal domain-containing protein [Solitalea-like symbiont of Acarus siro]